MSKIVQATFPRPAQDLENEQNKRHKTELEDACLAIFRDGTSSTPGLEGHHAQKAATAVPVALFIDRLQLGTRKNVEWNLALPNESQFKLSISREPTYDDFQCVLTILGVIRDRSSHSGPRLSQTEKHARNAQRVREAVAEKLINGDADAFLKPVPVELAEKAAELASQSPLVRRFGIYAASAQWTFSLPDSAEFRLSFSDNPDVTDLDCAIDVLKVIQRRYQSVSGGNSENDHQPAS